MVNEYVVDSLFKNILLIHSLRICRILKEYVLDAFLVKSEEVENHVFPSCTTKEITFKETPNKVFRREHENLVKEAEKSMKAVALITTIVFSAAITVPGGSNQETGIPICNFTICIKLNITDVLVDPYRKFSIHFAKTIDGWSLRLDAIYNCHDGGLWGNIVDIWRQIDLEEIQESSDEGTSNTGAQLEEETSVEPIDKSLPLRRSSRVSVPPVLYGFHITSEGDTYISDSTIINLNEPNNYQEAMAGPESAKWKEAMDCEIQSMYDNHVWSLVNHVPGRKMVGCKWVFKKKTDMDGNVHTYKARLVAKGFTQPPGVDYGETFSLVAKIKSIRMMLAIAAFHDYEIWQMDVKTDFLNGKLVEDLYMAQPKDFVNAKHPNRVCKLEKSIYGLKQACRRWNLCFDEKVKKFGFLRSEEESCVYVKASGSIVSFLVLYVNDILLIGNDVPMLQEVKSWLGKCFAMKDLREAAYNLGIRIVRNRSKKLIGLSQNTYLDKVLKRFSMENSKKGELPIQCNAKLSKTQSPSIEVEIAEMSRVPYIFVVGSIMYVMTCTRPDVSFALSMVSRYQGNPGKA
uniref:Reverse transcriptase Ty1/copia-type domain-containing protein n=1 Tax=Lactuca sativa TaxID=4236 RepID=A0A9R1V0U8_LACSA|nr:hypothetical protein LSAT_V11C700362840 [Lactuca sativa]